MNSNELVLVRKQLSDRRLTLVWLLKQLLSRGIRTNKATLSNILGGMVSGDEADIVIDATKDILADYDYGMAVATMRRVSMRDGDGDATVFLERFSKLLNDAIDGFCNCLQEGMYDSRE